MVSLNNLGIHAKCATTGQEGVDLLNQFQFDLILIDIEPQPQPQPQSQQQKQSNMTGRSLCRLIRNTERQKGLSNTLIFGLSRVVDQETLEKNNRSGMNATFEKGAVLAQMLPKTVKMTQQHPETFLFINNSNQIIETRGLSSTHAEQRSAQTQSERSTDYPQGRLSRSRASLSASSSASSSRRTSRAVSPARANLLSQLDPNVCYI